ncbi:hypothetical protein FHW12_003749 [Dokdonella fugitiva]|uniref:Uncharacterized protein n=1 Tax=Dokdonella fugitiva TaxID=328517 RepID=A0A839F377_9GAMM|nr:hypothetical protein [Dokdonella fugitiva]MBA8889503.1 hypothetical protein [Dokdonella fugitiva]
MNETPDHILADGEFVKLKALLSSVVDPNCELPDSPFHSRLEHRKFEEFDWAMSADAWASLCSLAARSGDSWILVAVLDPDPVTYYKAEFGYYNWSMVPTSVTGEQYRRVLDTHPRERPADSMFVNSSVVVWTSPAAKWAIWGERRTGLCVLAAEEPDYGVDWKGLEWAMEIANLEQGAAFAERFAKQFADA